MCKQKAAVLLGHCAMLEAPSALSIKTENSEKTHIAFTGPGMMSSFLTKNNKKFSTQKSKNVKAQDWANDSDILTYLLQMYCKV